MNKSIISILAVTAVSAAVVLLLISPAESAAAAYMKQKADLENIEEYKTYQQLKTSDQLDENDEYIIPEKEESGTIRFVRMKNNQLKVDYFRDAERTDPILGDWVKPGESIYADVRNDADAAETFCFSHFTIETYSDGKRTELDTVESKDGLVYVIPSDYQYEQLIVQPVGKYVSQELHLNAYYEKDNEKMAMSGEWSADGKVVQNDSVMLNGLEKSRIVYDYSDYSDDYYFESSDPKCFTADDYRGIVEFHDITSLNGLQSLDVKLHPYYVMTLHMSDYENMINLNGGNSLKSLKINGIQIDSLPAQKDSIFRKMKAGTKVVLRTAEGYKAVADGLELVNKTAVNNLKETEYTFRIPDSEQTDVMINICLNKATLGAYQQKSIEHATVTLERQDGTKTLENEEVDNDEKVTLSVIPYRGYYVEGSPNDSVQYTASMTYKDYVSKIDEELKWHPVKKLIELDLPFSDDYGEYTYLVDGKEVTDHVSIKENTTVKVKYQITDKNYKIVQDGLMSFISSLQVTENTERDIRAENTMDGKALKVTDLFKVERR